MAKRYHSGSSLRGNYEGMDERRAQEREDAGMISEDHSAIANMPQNVIMREYPRHSDYLDGDLNDTIAGVDRQRGMDHSQMKKHNVPKKV